MRLTGVPDQSPAPGRRNPLPEGTLAIAAGLAFAGVSQYGFLAVAARSLSPVDYAPLATFWSMLFILGPGFFLPLEQEVGRAVAARRARGQGGGPVVRRALIAGGSLCLALVLLDLAGAGLIADHFYRGNRLFVLALALGLVAFTCVHTTRGTLSGNGRFGAYGLLIGSEGMLRVAGAAACALLAVANGGFYGLAMVLATFAAIGIAVAGRRGLLAPGPEAPWRELSNALGFLLVASVANNFLLSAGPVVIPLLEHPDQAAAAGQFLNARVIAYIPIFFFQAVQAALLPKLASLAARGHEGEYRHALGRLAAVTALFGAVATAGAVVAGPFALHLLFGSASASLGARDLGLLTLSCSGFMLCIVAAQALVSLGRYGDVAAGWLSGAAAFTVVVLAGSDLFLRVELALVASAAVPVVVMGARLLQALRRGLPEAPPETIAEALAEGLTET